MKNTYYLVETDKNRECAEVIDTYTNKTVAIKECTRWRRQLVAGNELRACEGSKERKTDRFYVTNTNRFEGEWNKVTSEMIVH